MNFIKDFFTKDIWRKLIALSIACVLYLNLYEYKERDIHDVKLEITHDDPDIFIDPTYRNQTVRLRIKGSKRRVDEIAVNKNVYGHIKFEYNADTVRTGKARMVLHPENFNCGRGVEITRIEPEVIEFPVQKKVSREIKIMPLISGSPKSGKVLGEISANPATVKISGPEQLVKSLPDQINTETYIVKDDDKSFSIELNLMKPNSDSLRLSQDKTLVYVEIRDSVTKYIHGFGIKYLISHASGLRAVSEYRDQVSVQVKGHSSDIDSINHNDIIVFADLSGIRTPGKHQIKLIAMLNRNGLPVEIVSIDPANIIVTVSETEKSNK